MINSIQYNPIIYSILQDVKSEKKEKQQQKEDKRYIKPVEMVEKGKHIDLKI